MSKWVSRFPGYKITVLDETQSAIVLPNGTTRFDSNKDGFLAEFQIRTLSVAEIAAAKDQILGTGGLYAFGSIPGSDEGNINIQDAAEEGYASTAHTGFDVYQQLSSFDTSDPTQCPPEHAQTVTEFLENHYANGFDFVRVDNYNLTPPWPTYPIAGDVNIAGVVGFAKAGGMLETAIVYEMAAGGRQDLLEALQNALDAANKEIQEDAGLSATV